MRRLTLLCVFGCFLAGTTNYKDQSKPGTIIEDWGGFSNTFGFQTPPPDGNVNKDEQDEQDEPGMFNPMGGHDMTISYSKPKEEVAASPTTPKPEKTDAGVFDPMGGHDMTISYSKVPDQKNRTNDTVTWNGTWIPIGNTGGFSSPLPDKKDKKKCKFYPLKFRPQKEVAASPTTPKPEKKPVTNIEDWGGFSNTFGFKTPPPDGNVNKKEED